MSIVRIDTFANRLDEALRMHDMKPIDLARKTGIDKASISQWLNGKYEAKQEGVYKLANALGVSVQWLMGYDLPVQSATIQVNGSISSSSVVTANNGATIALGDSPISSEAMELLRIFEALTVRKRIKLLEFAFSLEDEKKE